MRGFVAFRPTALLVLTLALTVFAGGCVGTASTSTPPTPTPTPAPTPTAGLNLSSLAFTSQTIGTASMAQTLTLTNSGKGPLSITSITTGGTNSSDFSETNTCATSLAANANCVISVTFTPTGSGTRSASLIIMDNAPGSPQTISLTGMAVAPPIVVNVSPGTANVQAGIGTQSFSATLLNDSQNKGVNWSLSGTGCSGSTCGMLSASSSASGAAITYTAPTTVPNPATVILTATSVADGTKSAAATITITAALPAIAVTVLPATPVSVQTGGGQNFTATVQNDSQNKGVTWSLSGGGCSGAACGTVSAASSASGAPITYTAPANVPSPATVTLTATSVTDNTKSAETTITVTAAPGAVAVSVSPLSASVPTNGSQSFTATVQNDAQNKGVTWVLLGASCGESTCGTLSATSSASGVAITYTAPAIVPTPESVTLRATSVANDTKSAAATITVTATAAPSVPVNIGNITSGAPIMVLEANGNIDLAWGDDANGLFFSRSTDGGATFSTPKVFGGTNGRLVALQMAADRAGNINILSWGPGLEPNGPTTFRRSTDGGATFSPPLELAANIGWQPQLAVDPNGNIDIAWIELTLSDGSTFAPNPIVRFTRSTDGVNFSTPVVAATVPGSSPTAGTLRTAVGSQGQFYIFWEGNCGASFVRTLDGGQTFSPITPIPASQGCDISTKLTLDKVFVDSSDNINVTLTGPNLSQPPGSNVNLYFSRSTDQGSNFFLLTSVSSPVQSSTIDPINPPSAARFDEGFQQIAVEPNGDIDIVWTELLSANAVLFARSTDGGNSFTIPTVLSHNLKLQGVQSSAGNPAVVSSQSGTVSVGWDDDGGTLGIPDVFFSQSANDQAIPTAMDVSNVTGKPGAIPRMAVDPHGNVYLVWGTFFVRVPAP